MAPYSSASRSGVIRLRRAVATSVMPLTLSGSGFGRHRFVQLRPSSHEHTPRHDRNETVSYVSSLTGGIRTRPTHRIFHGFDRIGGGRSCWGPATGKAWGGELSAPARTSTATCSASPPRTTSGSPASTRPGAAGPGHGAPGGSPSTVRGSAIRASRPTAGTSPTRPGAVSMPEIHLAPVDGGPARRLTYWGSADTRVCGWSPDGDILAVVLARPALLLLHLGLQRPDRRRPRRPAPLGARSPTSRSPTSTGSARTLLLTGTPPHEPAAWKRYRGGATGRLWLHGERLLPDLDGHLDSPMFVGGRIAFLSDHEGVGNLYSCAYGRLRPAPPHRPRRLLRPARLQRRHPGRLPVRGRPVARRRPRRRRRAPPPRRTARRAARRPAYVPGARRAARRLASPSTRRAGRAPSSYAAACTGSPTATARPARSPTPRGYGSGCRRCSARGGQVAYVTDAEGEDAIEIAYLPRASGEREPRRLAAGRLGRVTGTGVRPGRASGSPSPPHDGRLLLPDVRRRVRRGSPRGRPADRARSPS